LLRLIHLSDIHFKSPDCLDPRFDIDTSDRELLAKDLDRIAAETKKNIDAILITGDITFKASEDEFETATIWIKKLADKFGIDDSCVFVVPGNHDVNRTTADKSLIKRHRTGLLSENEPKRHDSFIKAIRDLECHNVLMDPMKAYNQFAKQYGCNLSLPENPFWSKSINIDEKYTLCINGLTTTFFSNKEDKKNSLYLGAFQANFPVEPGIVNLAMFHHPKEWLIDGDKLEDMLSDNAQIWLSGHEHRQRYKANSRYIDLPSAAVNPSKYDPGASGYNIIDLTVTEQEDKAILNIKVMLRYLQDSPKRYIARKTHEDLETLEHNINIPLSPIKLTESVDIVTIGESTLDNEDQDSVPTSLSINQSNLAGRLWALDNSQRRSIITKLALNFSFDPLNDEENYVLQALTEINKNNLTSNLETLINEKENEANGL
jgi:predicted phosphodiesterase